MATTLPSAEVAADFQDYLQDLQMNNRYEISNLTLVAKENTEHAMAISRVLETHIKTVGSILAKSIFKPSKPCMPVEIVIY